MKKLTKYQLEILEHLQETGELPPTSKAFNAVNRQRAIDALLEIGYLSPAKGFRFLISSTGEDALTRAKAVK